MNHDPIQPSPPSLDQQNLRALTHLISMGDLEQALENLALQLQNSSLSPEQRVQLLLLQATAHHKKLNAVHALASLHEATHLAEAHHLQSLQLKLLQKTTEVLQNVGDFNQARENQWKLLALLPDHGQQYMDVLKDACATLILQDSLDGFLQVYQQKVTLSDLEQARLLKYLGDVMNSVKRYPDGLKLFQMAFGKVPAELEHAYQRVDILNGIAGVYTWTTNPEKAIPCYEQNMEIYRELGNTEGEIHQYINIAKVAINIPRYQMAAHNLREAIRLAEQHGLLKLQRQAHWMLVTVRGIPQAENLYHLREYARLEQQEVDERAEQAEPLMIHLEVRQHQQMSDFQKTLRMELEEANRKLLELGQEKQQLYERLEKQAQEFEMLANTDPLTGLANRRLFFTQFEREYARVRRTHEPFSVVLMDIDHFKAVNDTYSHKTGDLVLKAVAEVLKLDRRGSDLVARYGGEEFVLLLPGATAEGARVACSRIQKKLQEHFWKPLLGERTITMSFGICSDPNLDSIDQVLMEADERLYLAKASGRNCICG